MDKDERLVGYIEKIERLEQEKKELSSDINEVYSQAKAEGYDKKAIRQVLKLKQMIGPDRAEFNFLVAEYSKQIGLEE